MLEISHKCLVNKLKLFFLDCNMSGRLVLTIKIFAVNRNSDCNATENIYANGHGLVSKLSGGVPAHLLQYTWFQATTLKFNL